MKWRAEQGIDELAEKELDPDLAAKVPYLFGMKGKDGIPVSYFLSGQMETAKLIDEYGKDRLVLHMTQLWAKLEKIVYEFDKMWTKSLDELPPERAIGLYGIYDAEGFSLSNTSIKG